MRETAFRSDSGGVLDPRSPAPAAGQPRLRVLPALTSVRFFAALHVALYHLFFHHPRVGPVWSFVGAGYQGVSFFFVLSGFILTYSHARESPEGRTWVPRFLFARFARIYPAYLLSMAAAALLNWTQFRVPLHALVYVLDLLMLQAWSVRTVLFFNIPAWTLCCEAFFYLLFPYLLHRLRPRSARAGVLAVLGWWALAMVVPLVSLWGQFGPHWSLWVPEQAGAFAFAMRRNPVFGLPEFLAGVALGWLQVQHRPRASWTLLLATGGLTTTLGALMLADHLPDTMLHNGLLIPAYGCVILGLSGENALATALSSAPLLLLGEASYAFYLLHYQLNEWLRARFHVQETVAAAGWELLLFVAVAVAVAVYLLVERPSRRALLQWWKRREALKQLPSPGSSAKL